MQSVSESKQELEASIRYAENAISSAKQTIESMEFRQQMAQKQYSEQTGREEALQREVNELTDVINRMDEDITGDSVTIKQLRDKVDELESKVQGQYDDIKMLERDLTVKEAQAGAWKKEVDKLRNEKEASSGPCGCQAYRDLEERATMPVIPKDVAIAIFREGVAHGVDAACTEIDNAADISIEESEYCGDFEVSFSKYIDLSDHLDTDWMRGKCGDYGETFVLDCLSNLCADKGFECRIHGIDDQQTKDND